ncbi:MAG: rpsT [Thermoleophilia bacterium]|nr:rpsT [Thermoleophilia bacterium]
MANIKQQKKRIGTAQRQRMENLRYRSTVKTLFNRLQLNVDTGDKDAAAATHKELVSLLDRSITRGSIHRNTAARKKARASRMLLQEAKTDATTIRKAKKKVTPARKPKAAPAAKGTKAKAAEAPVEEPTVEETPVEEAPAVEAEATPEPEAKTEETETPAEEAPAADEAPAEVADDAEATEAKD